MQCAPAESSRRGAISWLCLPVRIGRQLATTGCRRLLHTSSLRRQECRRKGSTNRFRTNSGAAASISSTRKGRRTIGTSSARPRRLLRLQSRRKTVDLWTAESDGAPLLAPRLRFASATGRRRPPAHRQSGAATPHAHSPEHFSDDGSTAIGGCAASAQLTCRRTGRMGISSHRSIQPEGATRTRAREAAIASANCSTGAAATAFGQC